MPSSSAYADVTDLVRYGEVNRLTLSVGSLIASQFLGPYLLYPEESDTDQLLPAPGSTHSAVVYMHSLLPPPPSRYDPGRGPRVIQAQMMDHVTLNQGAELRVQLDVPCDRIQHVMYFESGFGWMGQHRLDYNAQEGYWTAWIMPGNRAAIQENEDVYVWAEDIDGVRSEYYPVKVGWDLTRRSRDRRVLCPVRSKRNRCSFNRQRAGDSNPRTWRHTAGTGAVMHSWSGGADSRSAMNWRLDARRERGYVSTSPAPFESRGLRIVSFSVGRGA